MFGNLSSSLSDTSIDYPISDSQLPFSDYIAKSRAIIESRRSDLQSATPAEADKIINANSPFELYPANPIVSGSKLKYGALLIHGLFDSPFSMRDIGTSLQAQGILSRAILLPGHGTKPQDLLQISYHDWIQATRYGVESLRKEVEQVFLVGYSTGATLSVYHALQDSQIAGIILLSPAIKIKAPIDIMVAWHNLLKLMTKNNEWLQIDEEVDYAKYKSIPFNPVKQLAKLTDTINELQQHHSLLAPIYMVASREDETISSHAAIDFFTSFHSDDSKLLLYTSHDHRYPDARIVTRLTHYPDLHISHFSHVSIPFSPTNPHYGQEGDYIRASHPQSGSVVYGAYNDIEEKFLNLLASMHIIKYRRAELTYNPDFEYMTNEIISFILKN